MKIKVILALLSLFAINVSKKLESVNAETIKAITQGSYSLLQDNPYQALMFCSHALLSGNQSKYNNVFLFKHPSARFLLKALMRFSMCLKAAKSNNEVLSLLGKGLFAYNLYDFCSYDDEGDDDNISSNERSLAASLYLSLLGKEVGVKGILAILSLVLIRFHRGYLTEIYNNLSNIGR